MVSRSLNRLTITSSVSSAWLPCRVSMKNLHRGKGVSAVLNSKRAKCILVCNSSLIVNECVCASFNPPGDTKMVKWIVATFKQLGHIPDKSGNLPIHFAVAAGTSNFVLCQTCS